MEPNNISHTSIAKHKGWCSTHDIPFVLDQLLLSIDDVVESLFVADCNVTRLEPAVWSYGFFRCLLIPEVPSGADGQTSVFASVEFG